MFEATWTRRRLQELSRPRGSKKTKGVRVRPEGSLLDILNRNFIKESPGGAHGPVSCARIGLVPRATVTVLLMAEQSIAKKNP